MPPNKARRRRSPRHPPNSDLCLFYIPAENKKHGGSTAEQKLVFFRDRIRLERGKEECIPGCAVCM